ncbi:MAG TPA: SDR family oxidoreductase [Burkholderiaceae bacterium]|nr:SDR family oxidoreductase [Burkholderiaceae bacterium]HMY98431.1 SDR family oxidoreductase [Burkholderiaceae bacterium]HNB43087.1 SDR family oxidoreductase [Burkholderiaceae bacterium]HNG78130.1 SDR family oxidoreductase [Burkholderiaceae bacterium]
MRLQDRVALVTGAGAGIGAGVARRLAADGAALWLADLRADAVEAVAAQIGRDFGAEVGWSRSDVGERDQVLAMVQAAQARFGRVDVLVNNAWGPRPGSRRGFARIESLDDQDADWALRIGARSALWAMQAVFPGMRSRGWGRVVNMCSLNGVNAHPYSGDYNMAKEALRTLTRSAAREWAPYGICCNAVCPAAATEAYRRFAAAQPDNAAAMLRLNPMGYMGDPERDIGAVVLFLASEDSRYLTGNTLFVDGGSHINGVPWLPQAPA